MIKTPMGQTFWPREAETLYGHCRCPETDAGGDCEFCQVYYNGPTPEEWRMLGVEAEQGGDDR